MSFVLREPSTFINIKLTNLGRQMAGLGNLEFKKAILSDREVDYSIATRGDYDILNCRVLSPPDNYPKIQAINLDGSPAINLSSPEVKTTKQIVTASTTNMGFFTGTPGAWTLSSSFYLGKSSVAGSSNTTNINSQLPRLALGSPTPSVGDLIFVTYPNNTTLNYMSSGNAVPPQDPAVCCWYKVWSASSGTVILDRAPTRNNTSWQSACFIYKDNAIEDYYGSGATQYCKIWNMNIVRTNDVIGSGGETFAGYTTYGSIEYNGTRRFFGFSSETPAVGFIHYTNEYTGNTYAEQLIEGTVEMHLPMIMWHHKIGEYNGQGLNWGASFYDSYGPTFFDSAANTSYRELRDRSDATGISVGRIYHKLKLIVITDQELLTALSYKANRNYTFPDYNIELTQTPKLPLTVTGATGFVKEGYDYFITYIPESPAYTNTGSVFSFGNPVSVPCGYIKKIRGSYDEDGNAQYLRMTFPNPDSFPYMRSETTAASLENGWNANTVQILVNEQPSYYNYDISNVPANGWKRVSDISIGGNGVYRAIDDSVKTIDPFTLNSYEFIFSQEDVDSGTTYSLESQTTTYQDILTFGDETFFHGTINAGIMATSYKSSITVYATDEDANSSNNPTFNSVLDDATYITEVAIMDGNNNVVAVGKPTYPIKKRSGKFLGFKLELDF